MADTLRLKRRAAGGAAGAPASLANAELAYNEQDDTLYYGKGGTAGAAASILPIAGPGAFLKLSGGTLTGPLLLAADPTAALGAATKQYADSHPFADAPNNINTYGRRANTWDKALPIVNVAGGGAWDPGSIDAGNTGVFGLFQVTNQTGATGWPASNLDQTGLILHGWNSNAGWQSQLMMGGRERSGGAAIWYRSYDTTWGTWRRLVGDPGATFTSGVTWGNSTVTTATDLSRHIQLYNPGYGFSVSSGRLNLVTGNTLGVVANGADTLTIGTTGLLMASGKTLTLAADPTTALHAATKQYADLKLALAGGSMTGPLNVTVPYASGANPTATRFILNYSTSPVDDSSNAFVTQANITASTGGHEVWVAFDQTIHNVAGGDAASTGNIVGRYVQALRQTNSLVPLSALIASVDNFANTRSGLSGPMSALELDLMANDVDDASTRRGMMIGLGNRNAGGIRAEARCAYEVWSGSSTLQNIGGFGFYLLMNFASPFRDAGIDFRGATAWQGSGTGTDMAIRFRDSHKVVWDTAAATFTRYNPANNAMEWSSNRGAWGAENTGKTLVIMSSGANPALGISSAAGTNLWALCNDAGTLNFARMPALTDSTTPPQKIMQLTTAGTVVFPSGANSGVIRWSGSVWQLRTADATGGSASMEADYTTGTVIDGTSGGAWTYSGDATGTGASGDSGIGTGNAVSGLSGTTWVYTGNSNTGNSGSILVGSGSSGKNSGNVQITTGSATGAGNKSGDITLTPGAVSSGATAGVISLNGATTVTGSLQTGNANLIQAGSNTAVNNVIRLSPQAAGSTPSISLLGPDTNIGLNLQPKGTGVVQVQGPLTVNSATSLQAGVSFGSAVASSVTDMSKHIALYGGQYGITITSSRLNYVAAGTHVFTNAGTDIASISATTGITVGASGAPNIRSGAGAATGTQPAGSLWLRTDGAAGSRLYVSAGGGTWAAVAGV